MTRSEPKPGSGRASQLAWGARIIGALLVAAGAIAHNLKGLPVLLEAADRGGLGLPTNVEVGVGITRETVVSSWFLMGMSIAALGGVLLAVAPGLQRGEKLARRLAGLLGGFFLVAFLVPWFAFEHQVPRPLPMPLAGLVLLVLLIRSRRAEDPERNPPGQR